MIKNEKRQARRIIVRNGTVAIHPLDPQSWVEFWGKDRSNLNDISIVGAGCYSNKRLPIGSKLSVEINIGKRIKNIKIFGKIAWISEDKDENGYKTGISFSWWQEDEDKKEINRLIEQFQISQ